MSSLILLVIVAAWLMVLVPVLLRRHDAGAERRSTDRFASAMRVLSRRGTQDVQGREVLRPARTAGSATASVTVNGTTRLDPEVLRARLGRTRPVVTEHIPSTSDGPADRPAERPVSTGRRTAVARRRAMSVLAAAALILAVAAVVVAPVLWVPQLCVGLLLVGYVVHVRRQAGVTRARRRRAVEHERRRAEWDRQEASRLARYAQASATARSREVTLEKAEDGSWHPVPVPVPTYVTAAVAPSQAVDGYLSTGEYEEQIVAGDGRDADRAIEAMVADEMDAVRADELSQDEIDRDEGFEVEAHRRAVNE